MVFPTAQRSATAKTKPTVYIHIIRENDPLDKAIEKAYGENFTIVDPRTEVEVTIGLPTEADPARVLDALKEVGDVEVAAVDKDGYQVLVRTHAEHPLERASADELHPQPDAAVDAIGAVDRDDVRMANAGEEATLFNDG